MVERDGLLLMRPWEAAFTMGMQPNSVRWMVKRGHLTAYRDANGWRYYDAAEVTALQKRRAIRLDRHQRIPPPGTRARVRHAQIIRSWDE